MVSFTIVWLFLYIFIRDNVKCQDMAFPSSNYIGKHNNFKYFVNKYRHTRYDNLETNCGKRKRAIENRKCFRQCTSDSDCRGSKRRCLCDGECGLSCVRLTTTCIKITEFKNGLVSYHPDNHFGSQLIYECLPGYSLIGNKMRLCEGDGWWSGTSPICTKEIFCDYPTNILNAIPNVQVNNQSKYKIGTEVEYQCDIGYVNVGEQSNKITCLTSGKWSEIKFKCSRINCGKPDEIQNGIIIKSNEFFYSSVIEYRCISGYRIRNGDYLSECDLDGKWTGKRPSCEPVDCGQPPFVKNAIVNYDSTLFGNNAIYSCINGNFLLEGANSQIKCLSNGQWQEFTSKCVEKMCTLDSNEYSKNIYNINQEENSFLFSIDTVLKIKCTKGYKLVGPSQINCNRHTLSGVWSETPPLCKIDEIHCPFVNPPENGLITTNKETTPNGYLLNTTLEFSCLEGYVLTGSKFNLCVSNETTGYWKGGLAVCSPKPTVPTTITTTVSDIVVTSTIQKYLEQDLSFIMCKLDLASTLVSFQDSITITQCMDNYKFLNTTFGSFVPNNQLITYQCVNTNKVIYNAKCMNGTLYLQQNCNELIKSFKSCSAPPKIPNGYNKYGSTQHGKKALYQCFNGYELTKGHSDIECVNGEWIGAIPVCSKINCGFPGILNFGRILYIGTLSEYTYQPYMNTVGQNKQIRYECDKDYQLEGPSGSTCINGKWKPSVKLAKCVKDSSLNKPEIINGPIQYENNFDIEDDEILENYAPTSRLLRQNIKLYETNISKENIENTKLIRNNHNLTTVYKFGDEQNDQISFRDSKLKRLKKHKIKSFSKYQRPHLNETNDNFTINVNKKRRRKKKIRRHNFANQNKAIELNI